MRCRKNFNRLQNKFRLINRVKRETGIIFWAKLIADVLLSLSELWGVAGAASDFETHKFTRNVLFFRNIL